MIALPPSLAGASKLTVAVPLPAVALTFVGELGSLIGVTLPDVTDASELPTLFFATTVNVYAVPYVNPVTVTGLAVVLVPVIPPGLDVTVYSVIALPPSLAGASKLTVACLLPAVAVTFVGAPGTATTLNAFE
ncbi:hypothetical protein GCM10020370_32660 [Paenibacillus hodogayensis]